MGRSYDMELVGGTDVPWSPTSDYIEQGRVARDEGGRDRLLVQGREARLLPQRRRAGRASASNPASGSCRWTSPRQRGEGEGGRPSLVSRCGELPVSVAERQARAAVTVLRARGVEVAERDVRLEDSVSPGSSMLVSLVGERVLPRRGLDRGAGEAGGDRRAGRPRRPS